MGHQGTSKPRITKVGNPSTNPALVALKLVPRPSKVPKIPGA